MTLFVLFALCSQGKAIPVYDCQHRYGNTTIVDLHEAATCPAPVNDYEPAENITVQILQTDTERPVRGYSCSITITREVTRCGFNSLTYGKLTTEWARQVDMMRSVRRQWKHRRWWWTTRSSRSS